MKQLINNLLSDFDIENIENAFFQFFIEINNISIRKNIMLLQILDEKNNTIYKIKELLKNNYSHFDIKDLEKVFELLIPISDRKINGAFFTPSNITNYIANELIVNANQKVCDPSCGCGAFLIAAIDVFRKKFNKKVVDVIEQNIFGIDILSYSIRRCKIILSLIAILNYEDKENININIYEEDSLTMNWDKKFPTIAEEGGFDIIIGNPPYVKFQDLTDRIRTDLYNNWKTLKIGTYNLYFAFFELGISLMKISGKLGYITPNNYFTSLAGIYLRSYFQLKTYVENIIDFNHIKIFDSQTYTCITFLSNTKKDYLLFERINDERKLNDLENIDFSKVYYSDLDSKKWRLLRECDQKNIKLIETIGIRLADLTDIRVGIATCKDIIYFIDGQSLEGNYYKKIFKSKLYFIEKDITKPIVKISYIKNQEELNKNKRRIIFPYYIKYNKANLILKEELKTKYPKCFNYLLAVKTELEKRDKGKVKYKEWYSYARSQGLTFFGQKILTPTFSYEPRFLYEKNQESLFCNGYAIFLKDKEDLPFNKSLILDILLKILNSKVMAYYIENTSVSIAGGYPCYQKNFIERFTIPYLNMSELKYLKNEKDLEKIDLFLIKKYGIKI